MIYEPISASAFRYLGEFIDAGVLSDEAQAWGDGATVHQHCQDTNNLVFLARDLWNDHQGRPSGYSAHEVWSPEKRRQAISHIGYALYRLHKGGLKVPPGIFEGNLSPAGTYFICPRNKFTEEGW